MGGLGTQAKRARVGQKTLASFFTKAGATAGPGAENVPTNTALSCRYRVLKKALLKTGPNLDSDKCGELPKGAVVDVVERHGSNRVRVRQGWASIRASSGKILLQKLSPVADGSDTLRELPHHSSAPDDRPHAPTPLGQCKSMKRERPSAAKSAAAPPAKLPTWAARLRSSGLTGGSGRAPLDSLGPAAVRLVATSERIVDPAAEATAARAAAELSAAGQSKAGLAAFRRMQRQNSAQAPVATSTPGPSRTVEAVFTVGPGNAELALSIRDAAPDDPSRLRITLVAGGLTLETTAGLFSKTALGRGDGSRSTVDAPGRQQQPEREEEEEWEMEPDPGAVPGELLPSAAPNPLVQLLLDKTPGEERVGAALLAAFLERAGLAEAAPRPTPEEEMRRTLAQRWMQRQRVEERERLQREQQAETVAAKARIVAACQGRLALQTQRLDMLRFHQQQERFEATQKQQQVRVQLIGHARYNM